MECIAKRPHHVIQVGPDLLSLDPDLNFSWASESAQIWDSGSGPSLVSRVSHQLKIVMTELPVK